ncbi:hypothetical protein VP01_9567g1, partial [Puccinia sorghi]
LNYLLKYHNSTGFDGCLDTPVEILHVFLLGVAKYFVRDLIIKLNQKEKDQLKGYLQSFNTSSLNLHLIQSRYLVTHAKSFIGKEFKIFLQASPLILFPFIDQDQCDMWHSLSILSSYAFQTHIINMANFQADLKTHISNFLHHTIKSTAQWHNKPKFHMLVHLPDSILRFGSAPLFSTEKFESYNGILRNASTHSNRLAPEIFPLNLVTIIKFSFIWWCLL